MKKKVKYFTTNLVQTILLISITSTMLFLSFAMGKSVAIGKIEKPDKVQEEIRKITEENKYTYYLGTK